MYNHIMTEFFVGWDRGDYLSLIGIVVSAFIAIGLYFLQRKLTDKQRVDHRLEIEAKAGDKLSAIRYNEENSKIQLYNVRLLNKKYFTENKRSMIWGHPYLAAGLYGSNYDGLEFAIDIEEWNGKRYQKVGVIPYENILGIKPEGDGSFNGMIFYVKPRLLQKDAYSISYKSYRYYPLKDKFSSSATKPFLEKLKKMSSKLRKLK